MEDLLLLVHRMPYPPNKGDKLRSYHLLRYLATRYRVHLGTFIDDAQDWQHVDTVSEWCGETYFARLDPRVARLRSLSGLASGKALTLPYYFDRGLASWVNDVLQRLPIRRAVVFSSPMAQYVNAYSDLERIIDFVDVDSAKWTQYAEADAETSLLRAPLRWLYRREGQRLLAFERKTAALSSRSVLVTRAEAELFRRLAPESADKTIVAENGVNTDYFAPDIAAVNLYANPYAAGGPMLVFTGAMDYRPNVDAVLWFVNDLLPRIQAQHSSVRFCIVGARPTAEVQALARHDSVTVTGTVDDVRPYLAHAALAVVPMRVARGIQNKALEAMAMARPVVITSNSAVALNADPNTEFRVADDAEGFVQSVVDLLSKPEVAERIGAAARACVLRNYSWNANLARLDQDWDQASYQAPDQHARSVSNQPPCSASQDQIGVGGPNTFRLAVHGSPQAPPDSSVIAL